MNNMKSEIKIKILNDYNKKTVAEIVEIHLSTFKGFFLTFMGSGFLHQMYSSYLLHSKSGIIIAEDESRVIGFLAYSTDMSGLYKYMIKHRLPQFAWYSIGAFFRKPGAFMRLLRAFLKPGEAKRDVEYVELASIGVNPLCKSGGIGSKLIDALKETINFDKYEYITLETDAVNNDSVNNFYLKNGFTLVREYETHEGRRMNEYRFERSNLCSKE